MPPECATSRCMLAASATQRGSEFRRGAYGRLYGEASTPVIPGGGAFFASVGFAEESVTSIRAGIDFPRRSSTPGKFL